MNAGLVAACAVAGGVAGALLYPAEAAVSPPPRRSEPDVVREPLPGRLGERVGVAVVTGVCCGLAAVRLGAVPELPAYLVLFVGLIAVSMVDVRVRQIPRKMLYPTFGLTAVGLVAASAADDRWRGLATGALAGAAAFAVFFALWFFIPGGMGFGDVPMAGVIGFSLGWLGLGPAYIGFLAAFLVGSLLGLVLMIKHRTGRKTRLPFGPALAAGAVVGVLWGPWLAHAWLHRGG
ncbi:MAG TPA: A24 family peptidase [Acidimicrobiales bacterium]|nr:A24 family peptidase [Acidimicrobiales bacterium]